MSAKCEVTAKTAGGVRLGLFERYLSLRVFRCIIAGIRLGHWLPATFQQLGKIDIAQIKLPVAVGLDEAGLPIHLRYMK